MRYVRYFIWFVVVVIGVIFTTMNARTVEIDYYFGAKANIFLPLLILIVLVVGIILGYLIAVPKIMKLRHTVHKLSRLIQQPDEG